MKTRLKKWNLSFDVALAYVAAVIVLCMAVLSTADILLRFLYRPISGAYEAMQFMMGGVAFFTLAYVQLKKAHISVAVIREAMHGKLAEIIDIIWLVLMFGISALIAWESGVCAIESWQGGDVTVGLVEFPVGPAKIVAPLGLGVLSVRLLIQIFSAVKECFSGH
jgi:TRAP-type C4-dicarboxylate transport system permease small subunit